MFDEVIGYPKPHSEQIRAAAKARLGSVRQEIIDALIEVDATNLDWYLQETLLKAADEDQFRSHARVLRYARLFALNGATVTFVIDGKPYPTPDLMVKLGNRTFFAEVKRLYSPDPSASVNALGKIVSNVTGKSKQLPSGEIGFVLIDNFDVRLESSADGGFSHTIVIGAVEALARLAMADPSEFQRPSGIIFATSTSGGVFTSSGPITPADVTIPHFVWLNPSTPWPSPAALAQWLVTALPHGSLLPQGPALPLV